MGVPGMVLGLGYIFFFNHPDNPLNGLYHGMTILVIATIVHYYTSSHLTAVTALKALDNEFEAVSASLKVPFYKTFFRVTVPVCLPAILDIGRYLFVNAMVTISAVVFLYSPDTKLASLAILNLDDAGEIGPAAAMATLIVLSSTTVCVLYAIITRLAADAYAGLAQTSDRLIPSLEHIMSNFDRDPILLTPGPLTTSLKTKTAMLRDWGSWDSNFNAVTARVRERLLAIVNGAPTHVCVPMQGSGTFSIEAAVNTLVPRNGHVLVLVNGAYGQRMARLTAMMGRKLSTFETADGVPTTAADVARALDADPSITHVGLIHCETSTGILNPLPEIADVVAARGKQPDRRCDEFVRRAADRCGTDSVRCADRRVRQVCRRPARHGLCVRAQVRARKMRGQFDVAVARSARPVDVHGKDDAVALHAADARRHRPRRGAGAVSGAGWPAGAAGALHGELRDAGRRHEGDGLQGVSRSEDPGADHRDLPCARRSAATHSRRSTTRCATRASCSIPAS